MKTKGKRKKGEGIKGKGEGKAKQSPFPFALSPFPVSPAKRKPSVAVVGAGRLGTALARALFACGYEVRALVARKAAHARRAVEVSGARALALTMSRLEELPPSDLLLITTPDDAVAEVAERLAALDGAARGRVALHTSGALSSDALASLRARGFQVGSMHPLAAVSDSVAGAESLRRAFYCVEGDARAASAARRVVRDLGARSFSVRTEDKALYHAAALMSAGHVVALFDVAAGVLERCGLTSGRAREVLLPLMRSALDNLQRQPPETALTGTFSRGDAATVRKHLAALRAAGDPEALAVYALLGALSLRLAARKGVGRNIVEEIAGLLEDAARTRGGG